MQLLRVEEMLDAGGCVKATRTHKGAEPGVKAVGAITALAQGVWQAALDAPGGQARDRLGETAVRARREAGEDVVIGVPARAAGALHHEGASLAIGGAKPVPIIGRNLDSRQHGGIEARLVEHHDNVRQLAGCLAGCAGAEIQAVRARGIGLQYAPGGQIDGRNGGRPRKFGDVLMRIKLVLPVRGHRKRQRGKRG